MILMETSPLPHQHTQKENLAKSENAQISSAYYLNNFMMQVRPIHASPFCDCFL